MSRLGLILWSLAVTLPWQSLLATRVQRPEVFRMGGFQARNKPSNCFTQVSHVFKRFGVLVNIPNAKIPVC